MKKRLSIILPLSILVLIMALATPSTAKDRTVRQSTKQMQGGHKKGPGNELGIPGGRWWQRSGVKEKLKLTDDQVKKLEKISREGRKEMIKLRSERELVSIDLEPIIEAKNFNRKSAEAVINKLEAIRTKMAEQRTKMLLDTREVLTYDQYMKLKELKGKRHGAGKKPRARNVPRGGSGGQKGRL